MKFSPIGFGCYRIDYTFKEHRVALINALRSGINIIDTSANYADGRSEILVGETIRELIDTGDIKRKDITIVTKAGYIQGKNFKYAAKIKAEGKPFAEVVEISDRLWHCIHPDFLQNQIELQLERLQQDYIDIYLLHNPEYYLEWAKGTGIKKDEAREIYYQRIRKAFEFLEDKIKENKIRAYGISSNTFPYYSDNYEFTSLEKVLDIANSISVNNHFKTIQLPLNIIENGAATVKNQINNTETILEFAQRSRIKVIVNRPLNAITSSGLIRLADYKADKFEEKDFIKQMKLVHLMEDDILNEKIEQENLNIEDIKSLKRNLTFGTTLEKDWKFFGSIEHYNDVVRQLFVPRIDYLLDFSETKVVSQNIRDFFGRYIKECYKLLNFVSNYYKLKAHQRGIKISDIVNKFLEPQFHNLTLSQKSILVLISLKGVSCVLAGMRSEKYVEDVMGVLHLKIPNAENAIENISKQII